MAVAAHLEPVNESGEDRAQRRVLSLETAGVSASGETANVVVHNASATGLLLETELELSEGEALVVDLPEAGETLARVVWRSGALAGCRFDEPLASAVLSAAQLRSAVGPIARNHPAGRGSSDRGFGARLERLRKEKRLTLAQIAAALGVSKPTVWAWEHGKAHPIADRVGPLAEVLGVKPEELEAAPPAAPLENIERHRAEIALAYGTTPDRVRISIEL